MNNMGEYEQRSLINELTEGREVARQLQRYLGAPNSSSYEVTKIQASYEKALSILNCKPSCSTNQPAQCKSSGSPPPSPSESPRSEDSDREFKNQELQLDAYKKRKTLPRWTQQVRVTPGTSLEGPLDDGFNWRKYGQKDILGAKYPRGYYRCTHRIRGCLARKQVQRSDEDPTISEITYRGKHTCNIASSRVSENQEESQDLLLTQDLDNGEQICPSFPNFTSSTVSNENNLVFSSPLMGNSSNISSPLMGNSSNISSPFLCPATSGMSNDHSSSTNSPTIGSTSAHQFGPNFTFDNNGFFP